MNDVTGLLFGQSFLAKHTLAQLHPARETLPETFDGTWASRQRKVAVGVASMGAGKVEAAHLASQLHNYGLQGLIALGYADATAPVDTPPGTYVVPYWFADLELPFRGKNSHSAAKHQRTVTAGTSIHTLRRALQAAGLFYRYDGGVGTADGKGDATIPVNYRDSICYAAATIAQKHDVPFSALLRVYPQSGLTFHEAMKFHDETSKVFSVVLHHLFEA